MTHPMCIPLLMLFESTTRGKVGIMGGAVTVESITTDQAWRMYDRACRRVLGCSATEFTRRWDSGEFKGNTTPEMMEVLVLRPSGR